MAVDAPPLGVNCQYSLPRRLLARDEIHLYFSYPEQISDSSLIRRYKTLLSDDELAQMKRFHFSHHRHQYLVTRTLVRTSLSAYYPVEPASWQFGVNDYGKPGITYPDGQLPIRFNLSHSGGMIICGVVRDYDIGVDVEDLQRSTRAALDGLYSYFSPTEIEDLRRLPIERQKHRFFDYWTLKESYIKARGAGLSIPLDQFSFSIRDNKLTGFYIHPDLNDDAESWQFWRIPVTERYRVAVAIKSDRPVFRLSAVNVVPLLSHEAVELVFL